MRPRILLALLLGGGLAAFNFWFGLGGWYWVILPALYFAWAWWQPRSNGHTLAAPVIYWMALLWGLFPTIGVNAVPENVRDLGRSRSRRGGVPGATRSGASPLPVSACSRWARTCRISAAPCTSIAASGSATVR